MRCIIYMRVSSDLQRERHTIASQQSDLPPYAERMGWQIIAVVQDDGISADTTIDRPEFMAIMDRAERREFDVLLVIDLDRITRSEDRLAGAEIYDHFRKHNVQLATPHQGVIDLNNEDQDLQVGLLREFARYEKRKLRRRFRRGRIAAYKGGKRRLSSRDPYGYRWVLDSPGGRDGHYEIVETEAQTVRAMYNMALKMGTARLVWELNTAVNPDGSRKYLPPRAFKMKKKRTEREEARWAGTTALRVLRSTTYKGELRALKRESIIIPVPPIVSKDLWEEVARATSSRTTDITSKYAHQYVLGGILRCGVCGRSMSPMRPAGGREDRYYRCVTRSAWKRMGLRAPCKMGYFRAAEIDDAAWSELEKIATQPLLLARAATLNDQPDVDWEAEKQAAQRRISECERRDAELDLLEQQGMPEFLRDKRRARIIKDATEAQTLLQRAVTHLQSAKDRQGLKREISNIAMQFSEWIRGARSSKQRREIARAILAPRHGGHIVINLDGSLVIHAMLTLSEKTYPVHFAAAARSTLAG